jgi:hypothetical protein
MFNFIHVDIDTPDVEPVTENGVRFYPIPGADKYYPSVTSITSFKNAAFFAQWRRKIGEQEANKITARATQRGTAFHSITEDYINRWGRRPTRRGDAIRASETLAIRDRSHTRLKRSSDTGASAETKTSPRPQSARSGSWREEPEECSHRKSRRRRNVLADRKRRSCPNANLNLRLRLREPHRLPLLSFTYY